MVKILVTEYPSQFPYRGNFEYTIKYIILDGNDKEPHVLIMEFYYKYNGNIIYSIAWDIRKLYNYYDGWIEDCIIEFNKDSYDWIFTLSIKEIVRGMVNISDNPNHFFYGMTYNDITKMKTIKQGVLDL